MDNNENDCPEAIARLYGLTPATLHACRSSGRGASVDVRNRDGGMAVYDPTDYPHIKGRAILSCEDVSGMDFDGADLHGMEAINADFSEARMQECCIRAGSADNADFSRADLSATDGHRLGAVGATFDNTTLRHADWHRADLRRADMWGVDAKFAKFDYADFRGADLRGADLQGADFQCADLRGVSWDERTFWGDAYVKDALMDEDLRAALDIDALGYATSDTAYQH